MTENAQVQQPETKLKTKSELKEERLQALMESCQQEVLRQIIGPFGLTAAMFDDKKGGNVATVHNAENAVFPDAAHQRNYSIANENYSKEVRKKSWDDKNSRGPKYEEINRAMDAGKEVISDATNRPLIKDEINGDHTVSLKEAHSNKNLHLRFSEEERKKILNSEKNIAFIEERLNKSKGAKSWDECLSDPEFVEKNKLTTKDIEKIRKVDDEARGSISSQENKKLASELLSTGAKDTARNALRQALGVVLHEFANGSFIEIKVLLKDRNKVENLIDRLIVSLKTVMNRVIGKLKAALDAALSGGIQGFVSNLLTFLINNLITTSKKMVTIIRESMQSIWKAIKMLVNPPEGISNLELTRQVMKIIAAVVTTGIGMAMEESIKGFVVSIPPFAPIADGLAIGLTAIMTGIAGALVVYGIDQIFDWLSGSDTDLLTAQEADIEAQSVVAGRMQEWLGLQFNSSRLYKTCVVEYQQIQRTFAVATFQMGVATLNAAATIQNRQQTIETIEIQIERKKRLADALRLL